MSENVAAMLKYTVKGLTQGTEIEFRVIAVNKAGPGEPSEATKPVTVKPMQGIVFIFAMSVNTLKCMIIATIHN